MPFDADPKLYGKAVDALLIGSVRPERIVCKRKLGQNRRREQIEAVLSSLWRRGRRGDLEAIEWVRRAHPQDPRPKFLEGPEQTRFCVAPGHAEASQVAALLDGAYWTEGAGRSDLAEAQLGSSAWLVLKDADDQVVASARANADGVQRAAIFDVIVEPSARGRGYGKALIARLLDHPRLRRVRRVVLGTRDAHGLYERFGFARVTDPSRMMIRAV